jgi:protein MpaA
MRCRERSRFRPPTASPLLWVVFSLLLATGLLTSPAAAATGGVAPDRAPVSKVWGESVNGRAIAVRRSGDLNSGFKVLLVGSMHGDEPQGMRIIDRINRLHRGGLRGIDLWTIRTVNPDGIRAGTRKNARGVDLNRNFGFRFDPTLTGGYESGPFPFSEPETRTVVRISRSAGFDLAIWYHQPWNETLVPCNGVRPVARRYARLSGLKPGRGCDGYVPGSAIGWMYREFRTDAFVVELGPRALNRRQLARHAHAALQLATEEARRAR